MKIKLFLVIVALIVTGCTATRNLWQKPVYEEYLTGFYWADKENQLIATGKKFVYATTVDEQLKRAISLHEAIDMRLGLFNTEVDGSNNFKTTLTLYTNKREQDLTESELMKLADAGFTQKKNTHGLSLVKVLAGSRYILEGAPMKSNFDKPYAVKIKEPHTYAGVAKKMVATPFALTYDTFVVAPIVIFVLPIMAFDSYGAGGR